MNATCSAANYGQFEMSPRETEQVEDWRGRIGLGASCCWPKDRHNPRLRRQTRCDVVSSGASSRETWFHRHGAPGRSHLGLLGGISRISQRAAESVGVARLVSLQRISEDRAPPWNARDVVSELPLLANMSVGSGMLGMARSKGVDLRHHLARLAVRLGGRSKSPRPGP